MWSDAGALAARDDTTANGLTGTPIARDSVVYVSYGLLTPTRAHNLQIISTVNALVSHGCDVTFVNPVLEEPGLPPNLPRARSVLLPPTRLFERYTRRWARGRFWLLFLDRTFFALRAAVAVRRADATVVITRDLVACIWLLVARSLIRKRIIYELHTLEQVMFAARGEQGEETSGHTLTARLRAITSAAFAGYQDDSSTAGRLYAAFISSLETWALRHADLVLTLTETLARDLRTRGRAREVRVVPSGHAIQPASGADQADQNDCRRRLNLPLDCRIAIYAGLSFHDKGLNLLFGAAQHLHDDCIILIVGPDTIQRRALEQLRDELCLGRKLIIAPRVPHERVAEYLRAADVGLLLYPRTRYLAEFSSPLKAVEYMACGLPVVATDLPSLREVVIDGVNGVVVSPDDVPAIAQAIADLVRDARLRRRLSAGATSRARCYEYSVRAHRIAEAIASVRAPVTSASPQCI
jgi:glycosyltransferase involved in cell wall biosynthesis